MTAKFGPYPCKLICLMVAGVFAHGVQAGPADPVVYAGKASYDPGTLTLTAASAVTQIGWKSFNLAPTQTVNFVLPNAQSTVLNQVFHAQELNLLGSVQSNGNVLFMGNGSVYGRGINLDLAGLVSTSLRPGRVVPAALRAEWGARPRPRATLAHGRVQVFSDDADALSQADGAWILNPGKQAELWSVDQPELRVVVAASASETIDLTRLLEQSRGIGIYAGLFKVPESARKTVTRADDVLLAADGPAESREWARFYRALALYTRLRDEVARAEPQALPTAVAGAAPAMLPALALRSRALPREIELGSDSARRRATLGWAAVGESRAARAQETVEAVTDLALAAIEPPVTPTGARRETPALASPRTSEETRPWLQFAAAEPPAASATALDRIPLAQRALRSDVDVPLAYAAIELPASAATRLDLSPTASARARDEGTYPIVLAAAEPPAAMSAIPLGRQPAPTEIADAGSGAAPRLELAAVEVPARGLDVGVAAPAAASAQMADHSSLVLAAVEAPVAIAAMPVALAYAAIEPPATAAVRLDLAPVARALPRREAMEALMLAAAEPPVANSAIAVARAPASGKDTEAASGAAARLELAAVEVPAQSSATRIAPAAQAALAGEALVQPLVVAAVEAPAEAATRDLSPSWTATPDAKRTPPLLELAAAQPGTLHAQHQDARIAPTVVVIAMAPAGAATEPQEVQRVKEIRIERRMPRYFTDHRGAMFFM